jgi:hypothetical protein
MVETDRMRLPFIPATLKKGRRLARVRQALARTALGIFAARYELTPQESFREVVNSDVDN